MKSILDPSFRYTASYETDVKKTFARIRLERRRAEQARVSRQGADNNVKVLPVEQQKRRSAV
jgi:hypothetical protein